MSELIICDLEVSSETPPSLVKAAIISARQETRVEGLRCGPCSDETPPIHHQADPRLPPHPCTRPLLSLPAAAARSKRAFCVCRGALEAAGKSWLIFGWKSPAVGIHRRGFPAFIPPPLLEMGNKECLGLAGAFQD